MPLSVVIIASNASLLSHSEKISVGQLGPAALICGFHLVSDQEVSQWRRRVMVEQDPH